MVNLVHLKRNRRRYFHVGTYDATIASMYASILDSYLETGIRYARSA
jgi:hypothetical protein